MNSLVFGIVIGIFLYFAGERFLRVLVKALKERRENNDQKLRRIVDEIVNKQD